MTRTALSYESRCRHRVGKPSAGFLRRAILWLPATIATAATALFYVYFIYMADGFPLAAEEWVSGIGWMLNAEFTWDLVRQSNSIISSLAMTILLGGVAFCMVVRAIRALEAERMRALDRNSAHR